MGYPSFNRLFFLLNKVPSIVYKVLFGLIVSTILSSYKFDTIELILFDVRTTIKSNLGLSKIIEPKIVLIYTTPETVQKFNGYPDFKLHQKLLDRLSTTKNTHIIYNYRIAEGQFAEIEGSYDDKLSFAKKAQTLSNIFFITSSLALKGQEDILKLRIPLDTLNMVSAPKTNDLHFNSKNPISRRILINYEGQPLIHQKIASIYNPHVATEDGIHGIFDHIGTKQAYITFHPRNSFPSYRFEEVLDATDLSFLDNKIILIGTNTNKSPEDYVSTPYSSETADMISTTELQANMFQTLIDNNAPKKAGQWLNILITALIAVLTIYVALSIKPSKGIVILVSTFVGLIVISTILLGLFDIWVGLAHPLLTIFLCYYFFIPYRLIIENRRSWEYIQKNKLLQQVEELKTNFISMMSHDLKTPIARIQGMTEVILKDNVPLSSTQIEAVDTIKGSSDDLLKFINSILQYGRIESQGVELHKQSKDINVLLQDIIKKHEFLAKVKKIKIKTEFEPMFPVQLDVELMKQVLSNLVENAIKYSPDESTVTVRSREDGSNVVVEVEDQGMGIPAEELPNIFMKFYRSQNVKTSTIKGTGLGLYLAQYFTKLHNGEITVTSEPGKGSKFRVTLPA